MGLPCLTVSGDLASTWHRILQENGLKVRQVEERQTPGRLSEVLWVVRDVKSEVQILQAQYYDRPSGGTHLIFMPPSTKDERELLRFVQALLVAAGAAVGLIKQ